MKCDTSSVGSLVCRSKLIVVIVLNDEMRH
ncbi:Uncharacterised protein [Vibrio cholerae]|nr:Uncharacterised protein [Vibrio cholerae]